MQNYVKFLKDISTKNKRLGEFETVVLTEGCSAMLKNKIPPKLKDLGSFIIPISTGGRHVGKALCNLGASINLMSMSIFKKLRIGEARPTTLTLQLADRSMSGFTFVIVLKKQENDVLEVMWGSDDFADILLNQNREKNGCYF
ncbi:uncharacterized protein LOC133792364 [Humulus lupulus]|uniref:uncharacterized protein LOC133792364 n=1 Tax=Humulus lupulus TaxID=3486 RepID=UPI002B40D937|nr:uncharacterized protein LOC133792364 [Humulus lupulus]